MNETFDVVIVGCGPVGQTLAILLGQKGRSVAVVEKQPTPYPLPRAVHLDHEAARILQGAGVGEALSRITEPADVYEWRNAAGETLLLIGSKEAGISGWPESNMLSQPELERVLDVRLQAFPNVRVMRGAPVVGIRDDGADVVLDLAAAGGAAGALRARYVVGCDGANSFVRRRLGVPFTDLGFFFDWLIVDVVPHEERIWSPINGQICDPARPTTVVAGGPGRRRWEFMRLPGETIEELDDEASAWRLLRPWDLDPSNATLERHAVYTFQARWADEWRRGRVLLAGDAAHQMPPFAGQGLCSGVRDAANLAWKLDLVLAGEAADGLLETYAAERIPQVREVVDFSIGLGRVICVTDPAEAARRDARMIAEARERGPTPPLPTPVIGAGFGLEGDPLAGHLFVQGTVATGQRAGRFDDLVGRGFALVSPDADPARGLGPELAAFFARIGGISAHPSADGPLRDVDRAYARWFAAHDVAVVLARPDFHVFGTARTIDGAADLVGCLRERLGRPPGVPVGASGERAPSEHGRTGGCDS